MKEHKKVKVFLLMNGYKEVEPLEEGYEAFTKDGCSQVDVDKDSITLIGGDGDWLHLPCNMWALLGSLLHFRELAINYDLPDQ